MHPTGAAGPSTRRRRRTEALSRVRIVEAAIEILDVEGEDALTSRLATGAGAIYWHVTNKDELLAAATATVISCAMTDVTSGTGPQTAIRTIALRVFDTIDTHPWVGSQVSRELGQSTAMQIFEVIGEHLVALDVPGPGCSMQRPCSSTTSSASRARTRRAPASMRAGRSDRSCWLGLSIAGHTMIQLRDPFMHQVAAQLREDDDREQFLAGIDLILAGIVTI